MIRDNWPAYNKEITPTNTMGAVAEMFRKWPGTMRSDHPARSVAAYGKYAEYLTKEHDLSNIFGDGSPIGKLYDMDGEDFDQIGAAFEAEGNVTKEPLGNSGIRLMNQRKLVDFAVEWIRNERR